MESPLTSQNFMVCGAPTVRVLPDQSPLFAFRLSLDPSTLDKQIALVAVIDVCQVHRHPIIK